MGVTHLDQNNSVHRELTFLNRKIDGLTALQIPNGVIGVLAALGTCAICGILAGVAPEALTDGSGAFLIAVPGTLAGLSGFLSVSTLAIRTGLKYKKGLVEKQRSWALK